ncbi:hypothetical protein FOMPIDRAFT_1047774 [Fomitopsis schrenkii]|uniref:PB1 domain-containing protein n=1 Tax=Fomitopsis schrenkii TaxID=2126942 RepID=S8EBR7_FOMSC|nr:hypothetical protein FOMPIDRAFT_1047774 [Fomitopsis schrenkii]
MSTPQLHIKLTQPNGTTRAVVFEALPTWDDLTTRVNTFFDIPAASVALAYTDGDGDEVTLSSQSELAELLSTVLRNTDSTTANLKFTVRDLRVIREVRTPEDANNGGSHGQPAGAVEGGDRPQGERAHPLDDGEERPPFGHAHAMPFMPSRGFYSARGRGGRGGMRGGFTGGPFHGYHGHHGPPGLSPPLRGAFSRGRGVSRGPPPPPMSHETFRAHSAPPEFHPEDEVPAPPQPEDFAEHFPHFPPFDGPFSGFRGPPPPHGQAHVHFHHHPYMRTEHHERGGRGRGGFGFGHHGPFGDYPHETFLNFDEHRAFGFGGRGGRGGPGFGRADHRMGMGMGGFGFDDPRVGMGGRMGMGGFGDPRVTVVCAGI